MVVDIKNLNDVRPAVDKNRPILFVHAKAMNLQMFWLKHLSVKARPIAIGNKNETLLLKCPEQSPTCHIFQYFGVNREQYHALKYDERARPRSSASTNSLLYFFVFLNSAMIFFLLLSGGVSVNVFSSAETTRA